jgi:hypothetical protein
LSQEKKNSCHLDSSSIDVYKLAKPLLLLLSRRACKVEIVFKNVSVCKTHNKTTETWVRNFKILKKSLQFAFLCNEHHAKNMQHLSIKIH